MNWKLFVLGFLFVVLAGVARSQDSAATAIFVDTSAPSAQDVAQQQLVAKKVAMVRSKTTSLLDPTKIQNLPIGIAREINGNTFVIAIDSGKLVPQGAVVNAYALVGLAGATDSIAFEGQNISINPGGVGGSGVSRIALASKQVIHISPQITLILSPKDPNYVEFDCGGFKDISLTGEFIFSRDLVVPYPSTTTGQVVATFQVTATDLTNMLFTVNISPFQLPYLQDVSFAVKNAVVDLSDVANPNGVSFPSDYTAAYGGDINLWHGFYIQNLTVTMPNYLKDNSGKPIVVTGSNMLIDSKGFSRSVAVTNLLNLANSGNDWPFSINTLGLSFSMSHLTGGTLGGVIGLPFVGGDTLGYKATVSETNNVLNLSFVVSLDDTKSYNMPFGGTLKLNKGSSLSFTKKDNKLSGLATLAGAMYLNQPELKSKDNTGLQFTNFQLSTESPYLLSGNFNANVNLSSSNFPISVSDIKLGISKGKIAMGVSVGLNLMDADDKSPAVTTTLTVAAQLDTATTQTANGPITTQHWAFGGISVNSILIKDLEISAITLNGELDFYKDNPVYGNGFHGDISLAVQDVLPSAVSANVYFGSMPDYRYWHIDVYVPNLDIPIFGPLYINGLIGGASYQMVKKTAWAADFNSLNKTPTTAPADGLSKEEYVPDSTAGLSLMAGLTMVVGQEKLANADAVLQITFAKGGGLKMVEFQGGLYLLSSVSGRDRVNVTSSSGPPGNVPAYAYLDMLYDADNKSFNAQLDTYINAYGIIKGTGAQGLVGQILLHFDPQTWYAYIGRPQAMLGLDVLSIATVQSYFEVGSQIDPFPALPAEVQSIAGNIDLGFMNNLSSFKTGGGIAFGAHLKVSVGVPGKNPDGSFKNQLPLPVFASLDCGLGADIMFRQYDSAFCVGSTSPIGIGGWYASGQAYAYLQGSVGVCWSHCSHRINFLSLGAAAVLQAKLPNPSWFRGLLAGHYSVLFGLIKGSFSFNFTVGDDCVIAGPGNELGDIAVISATTPDAGSTAVSVFASPQVTFNMSLNQSVDMVNDANVSASYRVEADEIKIYNGSTGINAKLAWNSDNTNVVLTSTDVLPPNTQLTFSIKLHWEKLSGSTWATLKNTDGSVATEIKQVLFTTGDAPGYIPSDNIAYVYPVPQQYNFLKNESNQGYIKLIRGQPYLFHASDSGMANQYAASFTGKDMADSLLMPMSYDSANMQVNFSIPAKLRNEIIYDFDLLKITQQAANGSNVQQVATTTQSDANNSVTVTSNNITGTQMRGGQQFLYQSNFRTSKYNSLADKVAAFNGQVDLFNIAIGNVFVLMKRNEAPETFDTYEVYGQSGVFQPLVQPQASNTAQWLSNTINPTLYNGYANSGLSITWRDPKVLGVGPLKGMAIRNSLAPDQYLLQQTDIDNGFALTQPGRVFIDYFLSYYVIQDYQELRDEAANLYISGKGLSVQATTILQWPGYIDLTPGTYPLTLQYVLPGTGRVTSSVPLSINF